MGGHNGNVDCPMALLVERPLGWKVGRGMAGIWDWLAKCCTCFWSCPFPCLFCPCLSRSYRLLARRLGKYVCDGNWVLEDLLGGLFEGLVVAHLHGDCPRERVPGFFDIGKALRVLAGRLGESFGVCVNGLLVGDLNEDPGPSNCI